MLTNISLRRMFLLAFLSACFTSLEAQLDTAFVRQKVEAKYYTFIAYDAVPMHGGTVQLTSLYDLKIIGDSVIVDLPYFGQNYSASLNPPESGIKFTSVSFGYRMKARKKRWDISIKPKDARNISELNLTVYPNGLALLQVTPTDRQPISFNGALSSK